MKKAIKNILIFILPLLTALCVIYAFRIENGSIEDYYERVINEEGVVEWHEKTNFEGDN